MSERSESLREIERAFDLPQNLLHESDQPICKGREQLELVVAEALIRSKQ